jgi:UDP-glucuronate 4-epimerase
VRADIEWKPEQPGDVKRTWAEVSRARELLGYQPVVDLKEGVRRFVRWMREVELGGAAS